MDLALMPLLLVVSVLDTVHSDPGVIPTKEEQANLLKNVKDVFDNVKTLVKDEGGATDAAVIEEVQKAVDWAMAYLAMVEELALTKLSCSSANSACKKDAKPKIQRVVEEGALHLQECVEKAAGNIYDNSKAVTTTTGAAMRQGQILLDTLNRCSSKGGLQQISCYKRIITTDIFPLKEILLDAIGVHKTGHLEAIAIRKRANECVEQVLGDYQTKVTQTLEKVSTSCA